MSTEPLALAHTLSRRRLSFRRLAAQIALAGGPQLSISTLHRICTQGAWPSHITQEAAQLAITEALRGLGVSDAEIAAGWQPAPKGALQALRAPAASDSETEHAACALKPSGIHIYIPETEMLSEEARRKWGLSRSPFAEPRDQEDVYTGPDQRYVREAMYQTAKHGGFLAVIGESGSGKSTLRRALLERVAQQQDTVLFVSPAVVDKTALRAQHICEALVRDLSSETPRSSLEALARQVHTVLLRRSQAGTQHCLLIEEAHDLGIQTLKYLKRFFELEDGFRKLLSIILIGQTELARKLSERHNPDAREVIRRCEIVTLRPLDERLEEYLTHRLARVGVRYEDVFAADAAQEIRARLTFHDAQNKASISGAYPLSVQNLVVSAMNLAVQTGMPKVDAAVVRRAAKW